MIFGTDLYGEVDKTGNTSIQTKFFHIATIPLIPLRSCYYIVGSDTEGDGINLLVFSSESTSFSAVDYAGINKKSLLVSYARRLLGIAGFAGVLFLIVSIFTNGGILTYTGTSVNFGMALMLIPFYMTFKWGENKDSLDIFIRLLSQKYFGVAMDPEKVSTEMARKILTHCTELLESNNLNREIVIENIDEYDDSIIGLVLLSLKAENKVSGNNINKVEIERLFRKLDVI